MYLFEDILFIWNVIIWSTLIRRSFAVSLFAITADLQKWVSLNIRVDYFSNWGSKQFILRCIIFIIGFSSHTQKNAKYSMLCIILNKKIMSYKNLCENNWWKKNDDLEENVHQKHRSVCNQSLLYSN